MNPGLRTSDLGLPQFPTPSTILVQQAFQDCIDQLGVDLHHDILGCQDCTWEGGRVEYCRRSQFHKSHPFHRCAPDQDCC